PRLAANLVEMAVYLLEDGLKAGERGVQRLRVGNEILAHEGGEVAVVRSPEGGRLGNAAADPGLLGGTMLGDEIGRERGGLFLEICFAGRGGRRRGCTRARRPRRAALLPLRSRTPPRP